MNQPSVKVPISIMKKNKSALRLTPDVKASMQPDNFPNTPENAPQISKPDFMSAANAVVDLVKIN